MNWPGRDEWCRAGRCARRRHRAASRAQPGSAKSADHVQHRQHQQRRQRGGGEQFEDGEAATSHLGFPIAGFGFPAAGLIGLELPEAFALTGFVAGTGAMADSSSMTNSTDVIMRLAAASGRSREFRGGRPGRQIVHRSVGDDLRPPGKPRIAGDDASTPECGSERGSSRQEVRRASAAVTA